MSGRALLAGFIAGRWRGGLGAAPRITLVIGAVSVGIVWRLLHSSAAVVFAVIVFAVIVAALLVEVLPSSGCQCGHPRDLHLQHRRGSDCSACHCRQFSR